MFQAARFKLAGYYVLFVMGLSLFVTPWVYHLSFFELKKGLDLKTVSSTKAAEGIVSKQHVNTEIKAGRRRLLRQLIYGNLGLLAIASVGGYALAWRTLRPIDQAMQAQERFTADASHELRTPLATIRAELEVALHEPAFDEHTNRTVLRSVLEEIDRISGLAEDLLLLARPKQPVLTTRTDLKAVAQQVRKRLEPLARRRYITLQLEADPECIVCAQQHDMERLITILVDNAIKYGPEHATVMIRLHCGEKYVSLSVHNDGPGIAPPIQKHLFERFYRADRARRHDGSAHGHGLGLAIAQKLATENNGIIRLHSAANQGTTFTVELPIAPDRT